MISDISKTNLSEKSDSELWSELKNNNSNALNSLFYKFYNDLYFYGLKFSIDHNQVTDVIQDVYANLWENRNNLSDVKYVKAYLLKIFRNNLLKTSKKNLKYATSLDRKSENEFVISYEDIIIEHETKTEITKIITSIMEGLTDKQREIIYLKFYCNLSNSEISESLTIEKQSVSNILNRTIKILREKLKENKFLPLVIMLFISMVY